MGMGNLIKYIRYETSHIAPDLSEADAKVCLREIVLTVSIVPRLSDDYYGNGIPVKLI